MFRTLSKENRALTKCQLVFMSTTQFNSITFLTRLLLARYNVGTQTKYYIDQKSKIGIEELGIE